MVAALLSLALLAPATATAAGAASPEDARPVAEQFVKALVSGDGATACSLVSTRLKLTLGPDCVDALSSDESDADDEARGSLTEAYVVALGFKNAQGRFLTPAKSLKAVMEDTVDELTFVIGTGPGVVRNRKHTVIGIDRVRSTGTRVVFYAESDSGTIFRLTGGVRGGAPAIAAAAKGVPEPVPPPPELQLVSRALADGVNAFVVVTLTSAGTSEDVLLRMVLEGESWRVDEIFIPLSQLFGFIVLLG